MTKQNQKAIAEQLVKSVLSEFKSKVNKGLVPESWDGFEIRQWLADTFQHETDSSTMKGKRLQEFRRHCASYQV